MNEILPDGNKPIQIGDPSFVYKNVYHPIVWLGADPYRPRVEMLTIKDRRYVFIRRYETNDSDENMDYNYRIPGGSIDADSDKLQQAIAETNEEGLLAVKNAKYSGVSYYEQYHPGFLLKGGDMPIEYKGSMNDVFVAEYNGVYDKSKVEEKDLDDDMAKNGKFYSIVAIAKDLKPEHLRALVYSNMVDASIVNFMRRVADSKGTPIGPQSDPIQTPLGGVESHVVTMEATSGKINIVKMTPAHVQVICDNPQNKFTMAKHLDRHVLDNPDCRGGVALNSKNQVIGYVVVCPAEWNGKKYSGWIKAIEVQSDYQKQGIGTQLLKYAQTALHGTHLTVNTANDNAIRMYRHNGFHKIGTNKVKFMSIESYLNEAGISDIVLEAQLTAKERKEIPDKEYGLPKKRKYPMPDKKHVRAAIRFFNYVDKEDEAELARNINKMAKKYDMVDEIKVGSDNRFSKYWKGEVTEAYMPTGNLSKFKLVENPSKSFVEDHLDDADCIKDFLDDKVRKNSCMFVDTKTNKIACVFMVFNDRGHRIINNFEVTPDYRGQGLSKDLLDFAVKKKGANHLWVNDDNKIAKHVYIKYGFKPTGDTYKDGNHTRQYMALEASSMRSSGAGAVPFDVAKTIEDIISNDRMFISQSIWDNLDNIVYYDTEEVGNSTVGSVVVFKDCGSKIGHLMLSVDTSATGFGVANDLMDDLLRNWTNLGVESIQVSVNDDYDEAIKLFLSYGFKEVEAESEDTRCFMLSGDSSAGDGERVEEQLMRCARDTMFQKYHVSPFPTIYSEMSTTFYNSLDDAIQALNVYYPCDNGLYYVFTKLDNQKVIPVGRIILRANDWKFNGWYDCFKFDKETTDQYVSQIDVNEVSGMRDEAIHLAQKVLRGEHDYGLLTESDSGEIWANISTPDKFVTEAVDSNTQNRIYRLNAKMNRFKYGFLYKGKILTDDYSKYQTMTVAEIDRYQCGVCWDFVNYEANWFRKNQIPFKTFYIEWDDPMTSTHTFLVYKLPDDPNYYYFESSFEKYQGVHKVISYSDAIDLVVKEMKEFSGLDKYDYKVWEYTASDALSHMTALQYMKTITKVDPIKKTNYGFDILESVIMEAPGDPDDPGTATDYTGGGTKPPAGNTMTDDQPTDYTQGGAGEEPAGGDEGEDTGNPLGADTGDDAGGDTGTDDPGAGDDAPTDYTDAGDDMGGDPGADPGEDTGATDDTSSDMSDSSTSDSSNNNIVVKNYSLIKDFEKAYTLIDDINKTIDSTLRASSVENQVLAQVSRNLTSVKEFIKSFVQFHFKDNDYAHNLYYYTLAIQFLKINLAMVEKITIIGD